MMRPTLPTVQLASKRLQIQRCFSAAQTSTTGSSGIRSEANQRDVIAALGENESFRNTMAYSLAMAMTEDSNFPPLTRGLDARMKEQLRVSKTQLKSSSRRSHIDVQKLPRTLKDALRRSSRAIVVTETTRPFQVYDVNLAWEDLCGYSYLESRGKSLGDLLKGPDTDPSAVTSLLHQLFRGEDATTVLTNYTKSGRKFRNRLSVGPIYDEDGKNITHFVGVLQEVNM